MNKFLRSPEVARRLGVDVTTFRRWCELGKGPCHIITPLGTRLFRPEAVEAWVESLEAHPHKDTARLDNR